MRSNLKSRSPRTAQRRLLLQILRETPGHVTARELYLRALERDAGVSLATVYRTLRLFKEEGIVEEMRFADCTCRHYEASRPGKHHHMVCKDCGRVVDFESPTVDRLIAEIEERSGFKVTGIDICLEGRCSECIEKAAEGSRQVAAPEETQHGDRAVQRGMS
jgi:Fur family transcriptional regulator, ferric uptake regulator